MRIILKINLSEITIVTSFKSILPNMHSKSKQVPDFRLLNKINEATNTLYVYRVCKILPPIFESYNIDYLVYATTLDTYLVLEAYASHHMDYEKDQ